MKNYCHSERGMALVLALAAVVIISTLLAGSLLLTVSHFSLSQTNSSYANALNLAEAGINWELWKISRSPVSADNSPVSREVPPGSGRSFEVYVEAYPDGGPWAALGPFWVISTGTVDGVSRTVRLVARGYGLSGLYALFGIDTLNIGGNATINGAMGTNGIVSVAGGPAMNGNFIYCGNATGDMVTPTPPGQVMYAPLAESFPTINELANLRVWEKYGIQTTLGIDFFSTNEGGVDYNDNAQIVDTATPDPNPINIVNYCVNNQTFLQAATDSNPYLEDGVTPNPLYGKRVIVLGPGDYYFESFDVQGNNGIKIDDSGGIVNIWLGPDGAGGQADIVDGGSMFFTSQDASHFHLYQGSRRALRYTGTMDFYGHTYAYNGPDQFGQYYGIIQILGDGNIWGSVIGYDVDKTTGSATLNFPSTGGTGPGGPAPGPAPGEPILFFGFERGWEELNAL